MQQARVLRRNRIVLKSNIPVSFIHSVDTSSSFAHFHRQILAYTIEDGHGGRIHVNVGLEILNLS
jgi:hypothetical protein